MNSAVRLPQPLLSLFCAQESRFPALSLPRFTDSFIRIYNHGNGWIFFWELEPELIMVVVHKGRKYHIKETVLCFSNHVPKPVWQDFQCRSFSPFFWPRYIFILSWIISALFICTPCLWAFFGAERSTFREQDDARDCKYRPVYWQGDGSLLQNSWPFVWESQFLPLIGKTVVLFPNADQFLGKGWRPMTSRNHCKRVLVSCRLHSAGRILNFNSYLSVVSLLSGCGDMFHLLLYLFPRALI